QAGASTKRGRQTKTLPAVTAFALPLCSGPSHSYLKATAGCQRPGPGKGRGSGGRAEDASLEASSTKSKPTQTSPAARSREKTAVGSSHCLASGAANSTAARRPQRCRTLHSFMSSQAVDCNALEAPTTSIEDITDNTYNRDILLRLKNDTQSELWLCRPDLSEYYEDYGLGSSRELDWLGHFAKKSTRLESVGILGYDAFVNCSGQSVDRFLDGLGKCNHIKKMYFAGINDLAEIINKLGSAMKSNNFTHFVVNECHLGVPETTFLFNTFRDMNSLEELCIDCEEGVTNLNDGAMAVCIPSLAACTGMRSLQLNYLNLRSNSCAALRDVFPQMATIRELVLTGNSLDDDCTRLLAQGLSDCKQIQSLFLSENRISDNGLEVLVQSLPTSVDALYLARNDITLARHVQLLIFRVLSIWGNPLCAGGTGVIAASLANPECRLEDLDLSQSNIGDEGTATLAEGMRNNQRLTVMSLENNDITERGWNAFSTILCDASSIDDTYNSNHTLQSLGDCRIPEDVQMMLHLNKDENKCRVAANKILQSHRHLDMRPLLGRELGLLPYVVAFLENFAKSRPDLKLSSIFDFVRAMPMKVTDRVPFGGGGRNTPVLRYGTCRARGELSSLATSVHYRPSTLVLRRARGVVPRTNEVGPDLRERTGSGRAVDRGPFMPRPCRATRQSGEEGVPVGPPLAPPTAAEPLLFLRTRGHDWECPPCGGRTPDRAPPPHPSASQPSAEASELARAAVTRRRTRPTGLTGSTRAGRFGGTASEFLHCPGSVLEAPSPAPCSRGEVGMLCRPRRRVDLAAVATTSTVPRNSAPARVEDPRSRSPPGLDSPVVNAPASHLAPCALSTGAWPVVDIEPAIRRPSRQPSVSSVEAERSRRVGEGGEVVRHVPYNSSVSNQTLLDRQLPPLLLVALDLWHSCEIPLPPIAFPRRF
ncbi:hypothetical protein THAOC_17383, partial [Thalassiosira oceanica]